MNFIDQRRIVIAGGGLIDVPGYRIRSLSSGSDRNNSVRPVTLGQVPKSALSRIIGMRT